MNKHAKKMLADIAAANDAGKTCRSPGHYAAEYTALDKLQADGTILCLPGTEKTYGYVIVGHPLTLDTKFQTMILAALKHAENCKHQAEREITAFEKLLGRNV